MAVVDFRMQREPERIHDSVNLCSVGFDEESCMYMATLVEQVLGYWCYPTPIEGGCFTISEYLGPMRVPYDERDLLVLEVARKKARKKTCLGETEDTVDPLRDFKQISDDEICNLVLGFNMCDVPLKDAVRNGTFKVDTIEKSAEQEKIKSLFKKDTYFVLKNDLATAFSNLV